MSESGNNDETACKDEDDDDDNDDDEKMPAGQDFDPERLKAFNVRTWFGSCNKSRLCTGCSNRTKNIGSARD